MTLQDIDKKIYRSKLNQVIVGFIITLAILAVAFGAALIAIFADALAFDNIKLAVEQGEQTNNFSYNFLGVILALLTCAGILQQIKDKPFFYEIYYIWQLKQVQNTIYRRLKKIKKSSVEGDVNALIILKFYYASLKQLYILDDNTITMSSLDSDITKLDTLIAEQEKDVSINQFTKELLSSYK